MNILGIGNDIIKVSRIKKILDRYQNHFLNRLFTKKEQAYCLAKKEPALHLAGRFAGKEAIVKALGTGFTKGLSWLDFEIIPDLAGRPTVVTSAFVNELFDQPSIHLSISHCHEFATAFAIWCKNGKTH
jgi:holo-[acyl-carrier protein] synthase